jgi:DNA-binding CsgD family transcriptional regulator
MDRPVILPHNWRMAKRWGLRPYSVRELKALELRANGIQAREIARRMGCTKNAVHILLWYVRQKASLRSTAEMIEWAKAYGFDAPLEPEPPLPKRLPQKRGRKRIKMGRFRRAVSRHAP